MKKLLVLFVAVLFLAVTGIASNVSALVLTNNSEFNADVEVLDSGGYIRCKMASLSPKEKYEFKSNICKLDKYSVKFKVAQEGHSGKCNVQAGAKDKVDFNGTDCRIR